MKGLEMPMSVKKGKKFKFYFKDTGKNTKETVEFIEKFYIDLFEVRDGATFEDLLDDANNPLYFKKAYIDESPI